MESTPVHSGAAMRPIRSAVSSVTIALLLATAMASLPASAEGVRGGDRASRTFRTMQAEAYALAGFELVVITAAVSDEAHDAQPVGAIPFEAIADVSGPVGHEREDIIAGLRTLPPPARC